MKWFLLFVCVLFTANAAQASAYSEAVRKYCRADYKKYCSEYGLATAWTGMAHSFRMLVSGRWWRREKLASARSTAGGTQRNAEVARNASGAVCVTRGAVASEVIWER